MQVSPAGKVTRIYPMANNEAAIGHNLLCDASCNADPTYINSANKTYPNRRDETLLAIKRQSLTVTGKHWHILHW